MSKSIYINLPAKDVAAAREFYTKTGFSINEQLSSDQSAVVVIDERIMLMLVAEDFFKQNTKREIADTKTVSEVSLAIEVANRGEVDKILEAALAAGGQQVGEAMEESGMYSRGFSDLDGHKLDVLCMTA
ncbi:MAG: VOC family protein [Patescibacteria group bacterium]